MNRRTLQSLFIETRTEEYYILYENKKNRFSKTLQKNDEKTVSKWKIALLSIRFSSYDDKYKFSHYHPESKATASAHKKKKKPARNRHWTGILAILLVEGGITPPPQPIRLGHRGRRRGRRRRRRRQRTIVNTITARLNASSWAPARSCR